jgi:hypothetical protein
MHRGLAVTILGISLAACAGRDPPQPLATVQAQDARLDCATIQAEIEANNVRFTQIADEQGWMMAQWVKFGMDYKNAAENEVTALQARQQYLTALATERCAPPPVAAKPPPSPHRQSAKSPAPARAASPQ